jgi:hypothetical protein
VPGNTEAEGLTTPCVKLFSVWKDLPKQEAKWKRDTHDIDRKCLPTRPLITWFVDCSDSTIRDRLAKKTKLGEKRPTNASPVDRSATFIRGDADYLIPNSGTLEDLRWQVDDLLFGMISSIDQLK